MKYTITTIWIFCSILTTKTYANLEIDEGHKIFTSRCASCHAIDKKLTGPALSGVYERRDLSWIIDFVHSSQKMIKNGDPYAVALFEEYNKTVMPDHPDLSADQITSILAYIKAKSENYKAQAANGPSSVSTFKPYKNKRSFIDKIVYLNFDKEQRPIKRDDYWSWVLIGMIVVVLIAFLHFITSLKRLLSVYKQ